MSKSRASSDAAIRAQYYRSKRKSPEAQAIADRLSGTSNDGPDTMAISRWNRGEDPALAKISDASAMVSPRGFTAAAAGKNRDKVAAAVNEALDVQPSKGLPASAQKMLERRKDRLRKDYENFVADADEYSGKPRGKSPKLAPKVTEEERATKEAEKAVQRQGLSAEDYWDRNPESKRTAATKDWSNNPEVARAMATGDVRQIEAAVDKAKAQGAQTASISGTGEVEQTGYAGPAARTVNVDDLVARAQSDQEQQDITRNEQQQKLADYRNTQNRVRKERERESADKLDDFRIARDQREKDAAKAEAYLENFNRQARAMRKAAKANSFVGTEGAEGFWQRNDEVQAIARNLSRMSKEEQLKWADSRVKADEEARAAQVATASEPAAVTEEQLAEFFNRPVTLTDFVNTFFGGGRK